jgi:predicted MarR family transcription regulator
MENYEQNEQNAKENKLKAMERLSNEIEQGQGLRYTNKIEEMVNTINFWKKKEEYWKNLKVGKEIHKHTCQLPRPKGRSADINQISLISVTLEKWQMKHDLEKSSRFRTKIENLYDQAKTSARPVAEIAENICAEAASDHATLNNIIADDALEVSDFRKKENTDDQCVNLSVDDRKEALTYAIRKLRMPDMVNDPKFAQVADVLEGMLEEVEK